MKFQIPSYFQSDIKNYLALTGKTIKQRAAEIVTNSTKEVISWEQINQEEFEFIIPSQRNQEEYLVNLDFSEDMLSGHCSCPYSKRHFDDCKHIVAAIMILENYIENNMKAPAKQSAEVKTVKSKKLDGGPFLFPSSVVNRTTIETYCNVSSWYQLESKLWNHYAWRIFQNLTDKSACFQYNKTTYVSAKYDGQQCIEINCSCMAMNSKKICQHGLIFLMLMKVRGFEFYFRQFDDLSDERRALLAKYELSPDDALAQHFDFDFDSSGRLMIHKMPDNLLNPSNTSVWESVKTKLSLANINKNPVKQAELEQFDKMALLFSFQPEQEACIRLELLGIRKKKTGEGNVYKKMGLRNQPGFTLLSSFYPDMPALLQPISLDKIEHQVTYWSNNWEHLPLRIKTNWIQQLKAICKQLAQQHSSIEIYTIKDQKIYQLIQFNEAVPVISFQLSLKQKFIELEGRIRLNDIDVSMADVRFYPWFLIEHHHTFYFIEDEVADILKLLTKGNLFIPFNDFNTLNAEIIVPLSRKYTVRYDDSLNILTTNLEDEIPQLQIELSELSNEYLLLSPKWEYGEYQFDYHSAAIVKDKDSIQQIVRNEKAETVYREWLQQLHPSFMNKRQDFFHVTIKDALKDEWYFNFLQEAAERQVLLTGMEKLKHFNFNTSKPTLDVKVGGGIDWFDVKIEVNYGGLVVPLSELKKAILSEQKFIKLSDGSLGLIPAEWVKKYSYLLKSAKLSDNALQVSKFQWTLVDELSEQQVNSQQVAEELKRKKELLKNIDRQNKYTLPKKISAELRDYQRAGFQWLCTLDSLEWGACLADDMGLGKTLQTLCFLAYLNTKKRNTHLIVCPTSLIYNWESEIQKFCKHLKYVIHYGNERKDSVTHFSEYDIVITSYGMVRSDIKEFAAFPFHYVILDESHAIKNPASQISKAVSLLICKNRLALSGTPLQNNTMDIYSQMNFLNPGMLGSAESFKTEFATPIDKHSDRNKIELLRKMLFPFMLRRTKEQVAKDLPDKTESILWCEMEKEQRKIYNSFKEYYRKLILKKIDEEGMNKSSFFILEGLLKLRQICDSPAILNEEVKYPNESVKIEELVRELEENTGTHKALVFSQFVTMLKLIENELVKKEIPYLYLDGQTKAAERNNLVNQFQNDKEQKVMLISLKAGGVGLNLTSADYVYLIDPWWNPAVEQQAVDRTHRIGQTQKVFAYKMICKDSIEEKILSLQQKKKSLSTELISGETSFVKKLTRDDIQFLFS